MENKSKNISIDEISKENVFSIDPNYFDRLASDIQMKTSAKPNKEYFWKIFTKPTFVIKYAIPFVLIIVSVFYFQTKTINDLVQNNEIVDISSLSDDEISDYLSVYEYLDESSVSVNASISEEDFESFDLSDEGEELYEYYTFTEVN